MTRIKLETDDVIISIEKKNEDMTWKVIMIETINAIKGMGYISEELENLQEEWYDC